MSEQLALTDRLVFTVGLVGVLNNEKAKGHKEGKRDLYHGGKNSLQSDLEFEISVCSWGHSSRIFFIIILCSF